MLTRHVQRAALVIGAVIAALLFFVGGAALRLLMGPISLGPFAGAIEDSINRSVTGLVVHFDQAVLEWSRADGRVNLIILGTKVFDPSGHIVAQAPKADIDFDAAKLVTGHLSVKRFALIGIQLTVARSPTGEIRLGFGPDQGAPDLLQAIRMALDDGSNNKGSLQSFAILNARLAFRDEGTGMFIVSPDANFTMRDTGDHLDVSLNSSVEISGVPARVAAHAVLLDDGSPQHGTLSVQGLSFPALVRNSKTFAFLAPYEMVSDLTASFSLGPHTELQTAAFHLKSVGTVQTDLLTAPLQLEAFEADGEYDAVKSALALKSFDIESKPFAAKGSGALQFEWKDGGVVKVSGSLDGNDVGLDLPGIFPNKLNFSHLTLTAAAYDREAKTVSWNRAQLEGGPFSADVTGAVDFSKAGSPAIKLNGTLDALSVADLLKYWPVGQGAGAHDWIKDNVSQGRVGPFRVAMDLAPGAFDADSLPDTALSIGFPLDGVTAQYIDGMTPLSGARGNATLTGDNFHIVLAGGMVGPLIVGSGDFSITGLHLEGAPGRIKVHADGKVQDVMTLIDEKPLGYAKRFNVDPATVSGTAAVDLDFGMPMLRDLPIEKLRIGVQAKISDLGIPVDSKRKLDHAMLTLALDTKSLTAQGTGALQGVPITFKWNEDFVTDGPSTHIDLTAKLDDGARAALLLSEPTWLTGPMPATMALTGKRFRFTDAVVKADLTDAKAEFPMVNIAKHAGEAATGTGVLHFEEGGAISISNMVVSGQGLEVRGGLQLDAESRLVNVVLSEVRSGKNNDFALNLTPLPGGGYDYRLKGKSLDATPMVVEEKKKTPNGAPPPDDPGFQDPVAVELDLERVLVRDDLALKNVSFAVAFGAKQHITNLNIDATGTVKGKVTGRFSTVKGVRNIVIDADDASGFVRAMTGFNSIRGGKFSAHFTFPSDDPKTKAPPPDYAGTVTMSDFTVTDQPFLARLFAAGSLDGPLRLMQGSGISIAKFEAPFTAHGKLVTLRDGRASGSAIGATFEGSIDRRIDRIDIAGSLVPAYAINSMLGAVPVLGDLFVSKPGEGIFGLTYSMKGNLSEPGLTVNPLSVLTPGILRRIFEFAIPKDTPAQPQVSAAPAATPTPAPQTE